jgi:hypothetical protein
LDRSIRRRADGNATVAIRLTGRPFAAVQADVIDGVIAANDVDGRAADRFRRSAWAALEGGPSAPGTRLPAGSSRNGPEVDLVA